MEFRPFSLADAAQGAASIQQVNAMSDAMGKRKQIQPLLSNAMGGDMGAIQQVSSIDPDTGSRILDAVSKMDAKKKQEFENSVQVKASVLNAVMKAPDVYKDQAWEMAKTDIEKQLGPEHVQGMPERFDPNWTQMNINKALSVTDLLRKTDTTTSSEKDFARWKELQKTDPEGAEAFGKQAGFISKEGEELSSHLQKRLSTANDEAVQSEAQSRNYLGLAQDFEQSGAAGGVEAKWTETMKGITGQEDSVSKMRQEYRLIRNSEAVNNLPPGVASDKDIELALSGFPSDTSNTQYIASFMRGLAKLAKHRADYNAFKSEYISENGTERGFLKAWKERTKDIKPEEPAQQTSQETSQQDDPLGIRY